MRLLSINIWTNNKEHSNHKKKKDVKNMISHNSCSPQCHALLARIREVTDLLPFLPDVKREPQGVRNGITGAIHNGYC